MPDAIKPEQPQELETVLAEKFVKVYANAVNLEMTPWDFSLLFGELKKSNDKVVIEHSVGIIMSPQHAKALAGVLLNQLKEYEKRIGEIKLPEQPEATAESKTQMATAGIKTN
jgi:hypothetical protein